jgi:putative heme-binding domain-containing protein
MRSTFRFLVGLAGLLVAAGAPRTAAQDHGEITPAMLEAGARVYFSQCSGCHGQSGDLVSGIDLRRQVFRRASSDEDLARVITKGVPGTGMPPVALQPPEVTNVIAFIRAGFDPNARPVKVGTAAPGKAIVEGKGACLSCHRITGVGSRVGPDLSDVGAARAPDGILRSLTDPTSGMMPINRPVRITMKDGRTIAGRRLNEDTFTVQIIDDKERLHSLEKSNIRSLAVETKSPMPSYAGKLTDAEIADVIAYLLTLRGQ